VKNLKIKKNNFIILIILFISSCLLFNNNIVYGQNLTFGVGFGYTDIINNDSSNLNAYLLTPQPALGYELFGYFSLPFLNNIDLILGIKVISKGFLYSENKKYELVYLQPVLKFRFLFFRNLYSKAFFDFGINVSGNLIYDFILDYNNFSIYHDDNINMNQHDNSLDIGTGIIFKNIIFSLNIYLQIDNSRDIDEEEYSNYCMIFSIGIIL